jgi:hypothetical protein
MSRETRRRQEARDGRRAAEGGRTATGPARRGISEAACGGEEVNPGRQPRGGEEVNPGRQLRGGEEVNPGRQPRGGEKGKPGSLPRGGEEVNPGRQPQGGEEGKPVSRRRGGEASLEEARRGRPADGARVCQGLPVLSDISSINVRTMTDILTYLPETRVVSRSDTKLSPPL